MKVLYKYDIFFRLYGLIKFYMKIRTYMTFRIATIMQEDFKPLGEKLRFKRYIFKWVG